MNYRFEHNLSCTNPVLHAQSFAHVAHAFLNNIYIGWLLIFQTSWKRDITFFFFSFFFLV
jgi:hypothetical protein